MSVGTAQSAKVTTSYMTKLRVHLFAIASRQSGVYPDSNMWIPERFPSSMKLTSHLRLDPRLTKHLALQPMPIHNYTAILNHRNNFII
jgi:hypothetical protein